MILQLDPSDRRSAILQLLLFSGMRIHECLSLTWDHVDAENGILIVDRQLLGMYTQSGVNSYYYTATKNNRPRKIQLPPQGRDLLLYLRRSELGGENSPERFPANGLLFHTQSGAALRAQHIRIWFHHLLQEHGYPLYRLHDLRHTFATVAYRESGNLKGVSELLGHADVHITANVYCDTTDSMLQALAAAQQHYFETLCREIYDANL